MLRETPSASGLPDDLGLLGRELRVVQHAAVVQVAEPREAL
jgi:hypothetical protein